MINIPCKQAQIAACQIITSLKDVWHVRYGLSSLILLPKPIAEIDRTIYPFDDKYVSITRTAYTIAQSGNSYRLAKYLDQYVD